VEVKAPGGAVIPTQAVEELIQKAPYRFILDRCLCRSLESCRNYPRELGCLFLGDGAREIAPGLGREADPEEALTHHRRAIALGLIPMVGKLRWDSLWLGVKKADELVTICHCCDCCCYFRLYRVLPAEAAKGLQKLEGVNIEVGDACDGCGVCIEKCFIRAMTLKDGKAVPGEACRGCGRCAVVCPKQAVKVVFSKGELGVGVES
jgi:ferredoxin